MDRDVWQNEFSTVIRRILITAAMTALSVQCFALLRMPSLFGDHMMLQAGQRTPIYGKATPKEVIHIRLGSHVADAQADDDGNWRVEMDLPHKEGPLDLEVQDKSDRLVFRDVLIGEVWLCSGQSNMEWSYHAAKLAGQSVEIGNPEQPEIRLYKVEHRVSQIPLHEPLGKWVVCTRDSMNDFSLLGYLFGSGLHQRLGCPVGLIESDWGGTPAESWTPLSTLQSSPELQPLIGSKMSVPAGAGQEDPSRPKPERAACVLYNGMINPILPYGFRGVAWYQGESNVGRAEQYRTLFPAMITAWRKNAGRDFPFLFVQLANYDPSQAPSDISGWAPLRQAQEAALQLPQTAMVTAVDLARPDNIHGIQRDRLALRLVWSAMNRVYQLDKAQASGPVFRSFSVKGNQVTIEFDSIANGLMTQNGNGLRGFEVAGKDHVYHTAFAHIENGTVVLFSPKVDNPLAVRYGWGDNPKISLYNTAGLPAIPFRTDNWKS